MEFQCLFSLPFYLGEASRPLSCRDVSLCLRVRLSGRRQNVDSARSVVADLSEAGVRKQPSEMGLTPGPRHSLDRDSSLRNTPSNIPFVWPLLEFVRQSVKSESVR